MRTRKSALRPELLGVHPRVYVTDKELAELRERARTSHRELWQRTLSRVRALAADPPPPPAQKRRQQNEVGIAIAEAAFVYKIEGDKKYLDAARKYMDAAVSYDIWGYANNKPNVDLAAGHLLYGLGWGYDLLYHDLTEKERTRYRDKLIKQARLLADYFKPKPGRTFAYSQNHTFIPHHRPGCRCLCALRRDSRSARLGQPDARHLRSRVGDVFRRTVTTTKALNTGSSRRRGWSTISTRTRTRPAKTFTIARAFV